MQKLPLYTRKKKAQYRNTLLRIKALQIKEYQEIYGEEEQSFCPAISWREALRIGAIS